MKKVSQLVITILVALACASSCSGWLDIFSPDKKEYNGPFDNVLVMYLAGYNSLTSYIGTNVSELATGYIPERSDKNALFVFSHLSLNQRYAVDVAPVIYRMYTYKEKVVFDTLKVYPANTPSATDSTLNDALSFVNTNYPSSHIGLLLSSHGTGWLPLSYKLNSEKQSWFLSKKVQTVGNQASSESSRAYEIEVEDFRDALPRHLDYIIFDACLMGGVETTYTLRNSADYIVASPAEISAQGFDYTKMTTYLLRDSIADLRTFCDSCCVTSARAGTIALYDCKYAQDVADAVKPIYRDHRSTILDIDEYNIQDYNFSYDYHFDFRDVCAAMGASAAELEALDQALDKCVIFKKASKYFLGFYIDPEKYSGISCYLPRSYRTKLNELYKKTEWNQQTGLLE